jgi:Bacterial dnaA protein helix-turn-helix
MRIVDIQAATALVFGVTVDALRGKALSRKFARPRQVAMFLSRQHTGRSSSEIGRLFGNRDHTTVLHACEVVPELAKRDPELARRIALVEVALQATPTPTVNDLEIGDAAQSAVNGAGRALDSAVARVADEIKRRLAVRAKDEPLTVLVRLAELAGLSPTDITEFKT